MSSINQTSMFYKNGTVDVKKYGLTIVDEPGKFELINKNKLMIDRSYQRSASEIRVKLINKDWSWVACGAIIVAKRKEGYFVVDGQHRVLAALTRPDITTLPCIVFNVKDIKDEAQGFITTQVGRKPLQVIDKFNALVISGDKTAILVQELLDEFGLRPGKSFKSPKNVQCLSVLMRWIEFDSDIIENIWPTIVELCKGNTITKDIVDGIAYVANYAEDEGILTDYWKKRLLRVGYDKVVDSIHKSKIYFNKGGEKICGIGVLNALNKGNRAKIKIKGVEM